MKSNNKLIALVVIVLLGLSMNNCGGDSMPNNDVLGQLPALSDMYQVKIETYKEKAKQATNIDDAYKYEKKYMLAKEDSDKVIAEYVQKNLLNIPIPFDMTNNSTYETTELMIIDAQRNRLNIKGEVIIKENTKNKYGGFKNYFFAYIKAVDKDGNMVGMPTIMSANISKNKPFIINMRVPITGSIGNLRHFAYFEKILFITKEEYDILK